MTVNKDLKQELIEKEFLIPIETSFFNEKTGEWEIKRNWYLKIEGKIYIARGDIEEVRFFILENNDKSVIVKTTIKTKKAISEGIAEVKKKIKTKKGEIENIKTIEKAQSIALGKALSYLGYGIEFGGLVSAEEIEDASKEVESQKEEQKEEIKKENKEEKYKSVISGEEVSDKVAQYSKSKYGMILTYEEQKKINKMMNEGLTTEEAVKKLQEEKVKEDIKEELPF